MAHGAGVTLSKSALVRTLPSSDLWRRSAQCPAFSTLARPGCGKLIRLVQQNSSNARGNQSCTKGSMQKSGEYRLRAMILSHHNKCRAFAQQRSRGVFLSRIYIVNSAKLHPLIRLRSKATRVDPPNISDLCEKARLSLTKEEVADIEPQLVQIADWFSQLRHVELENIAPSIRAGDLENGATFRPDLPEPFPEREAMLAAAPDLQGLFLKVPKILKESIE